jgi:hypothetical protein
MTGYFWKQLALPQNCTDNVRVFDFISAWLQPGGAKREITNGNRLNGFPVFPHISVTRVNRGVNKTKRTFEGIVEVAPRSGRYRSRF